MSVADSTPAIIVDERRPLLADVEQPLNAGPATGAQDDTDAGNLTKDDDAPPETKRTWWTIFWYALFTTAGVVILGVFIKGFIDADDVEV